MDGLEVGDAFEFLAPLVGLGEGLVVKGKVAHLACRGAAFHVSGDSDEGVESTGTLRGVVEELLPPESRAAQDQALGVAGPGVQGLSLADELGDDVGLEVLGDRAWGDAHKGGDSAQPGHIKTRRRDHVRDLLELRKRQVGQPFQLGGPDRSRGQPDLGFAKVGEGGGHHREPRRLQMPGPPGVHAEVPLDKQVVAVHGPACQLPAVG